MSQAGVELLGYRDATRPAATGEFDRVLMDEERAHQIAFEVDYWKAVLRELHTINKELVELAHDIARIPVTALPFAMLVRTDDDVNALAILNESARSAMGRILVMMDGGPLERISDLAGGRGLALQAELGGDG